MAGNKLERDQNLTEPSKDEAVQQKEEIPDQPSQDEMRSTFIIKTCQLSIKFDFISLVQGRREGVLKIA
jgi:hypothetical protein